MGANCCVAARGKPLSNRNGQEVSTYRNIRYSPTWSFRWDNRTHIEDIVENTVPFSHHNSGIATSEVKSAVDTETDGLSDDESPPKAYPSSQWRKPYVNGDAVDSKIIDTDQTATGNSFQEGKMCIKSSVLHPASYKKKASISIPYLSPAVNADEPSSSKNCPIPSVSTPRKSRHSSSGCYQLSRQISDSKISSLKNEGGSPVAGRHSYALSNGLSVGESHSGSSDGWSMRTFSELVASSSQRERWSFESENLCFSGNIIHPQDNQTCCICLKQLKEKSPWSTQKIISTNDLPVVAVLVCSHAYHSECLESLTPEAEMYDPPCPACANNCGKPAPKHKGRKSKVALGADADVFRDSASNNRGGKGPIMAARSSSFTSSALPILKRHFSINSRPLRSASESQTSRKRGFWAKY